MNNNQKIYVFIFLLTNFHFLIEAKKQGLVEWLIMNQGNQIDTEHLFQFTDCGGKEAVIHMKKLEASPNIFKFPQDILLTANLVLDKDLVGPMRTELVVQREFPFVGIVQIPCLRSFGSCAYSNICDVLSAAKLTKDKIARNTTNACTWVSVFGLNCGCPIRKGVYEIENVKLPIAGTLLPDWLESGTYDANFKIFQGYRTIGCFQTSFTIQQ